MSVVLIKRGSVDTETDTQTEDERKIGRATGRRCPSLSQGERGTEPSFTALRRTQPC